LKQTVEALVKATRLDDTDEPELTRVRTAAAIALGKIGTDAAVDRLIELTEDEQPTVRTAAWLGLGASGHDRARRALLEPATPPQGRDRAARVTALGLLEKGDKEAIKLLRSGLLEAGLAEDQRVLLKSLRLLGAPDLGAINREVLRRTTSATVASEAVLGMGVRPVAEDAELMLSLLRGGPPASGLGFGNNGLSSETCFAAAQVLDGYAGMVTDKRLRRVLSDFVSRTTPTAGGDYYRGAVLLSLVPMAQREDERVFEDALDGRTRVNDTNATAHSGRREMTRERDFNRRKDPIRGHAAIAMGMYLHRFGGEVAEQKAVPIRYQHESDRANRRFLDKLERTLADKRESADVRAAAAMGLAFSGHGEAAGMIAGALEAVDPDDLMVIGYGTLAMALLGDERAAVPAARYLKQLDEARGEEAFSTLYSTQDVLGLRAMVLTLGLFADSEDGPVLAGVWGADPWLSLESARVLSWLEDDSLAQRLTGLLSEDPAKPEAVLAAMGLGELFDSSRPSRFSRLSAGSNYTLRYSDVVRIVSSRSGGRPGESSRSLEACVSRMQSSITNRAYQTQANVFLYEVLLGR
jgi:HEAT repeats